MVTIKKRTIIVLLIILIIAFFVYKANSVKYPDIDTPKPVYGSKDAKVKIIEFSDLQCPACKAANPTVQQIKEEYKDKISFEYYHLPLRSIHKYAQKAAEAAECANDQGKMFKYIDAAFEISPELSTSNLKKVATQIGLDTKSFNACLDSGAKKKYVNTDYNVAMSKGLRGTPTFFINDKKLENWAYENFKDRIEQELKN